VVVGRVVRAPARAGEAYELQVDDVLKGTGIAGRTRIQSLVRDVPGVANPQLGERLGRRLVVFLDTAAEVPRTLHLTDLTSLDEFETGSGTAHAVLLKRLGALQQPDEELAVRAWCEAIESRDSTLRLLALDRVSLSGTYADVERALAEKILAILGRHRAEIAASVLKSGAEEPSAATASARLRALIALADACPGLPGGRAKVLEVAAAHLDHEDATLRLESVELLIVFGDERAPIAVQRLVSDKHDAVAVAALEVVQRAALARRSCRDQLAADAQLVRTILDGLARSGVQHAAVIALEAVIHGRTVDLEDAKLREAVARWARWGDEHAR
jgi:hypothetical protein